MLQDIVSRITFGVEIETLKGECYECEGTGRVYCPECDGSGEVKCETCEGYGDWECEDCEGSGRVECPECGGEGCEECCRSGWVNCKSCNGYGGITCPDCEGLGWVPCDKCSGNGRFECPECGGTGLIGPIPPDGWEHYSEHCGLEFKTPVLNLSEYEDFLDSAFSLMHDAVFDSSHYSDPTGMHVHVGVEDLGVDTKRLLERLVDVWLAIEERMYDYVACTTEERVKYAYSWREYYGTRRHAEVYVKDMIKELRLFRLDRYIALNLAAYDKHGTVEFRLWNSPEDRQYLRTAVTYSIGVVVYAALRSFDNLPVTEEQVFSFLSRWYAFMNNNIGRRSALQRLAA